VRAGQPAEAIVRRGPRSVEADRDAREAGVGDLGGLARVDSVPLVASAIRNPLHAAFGQVEDVGPEQRLAARQDEHGLRHLGDRVDQIERRLRRQLLGSGDARGTARQCRQLRLHAFVDSQNTRRKATP
jgi:hypothetical protein